MNHRRLYCVDLQEGTVVLHREESHHAIKVLRLGVGDGVELFDGQGRYAAGRIVVADARRLELEVPEIGQSEPESGVRLTLAVAMPKSHRQTFLVEKCTELGVHAIWPLTTCRSVANPSSGVIDKLRRRALEACKQSRRSWMPDISITRSLPSLLSDVDQFDQIWLLDTAGTTQPLGRFDCRSDQLVLALIGPEGGFSQEERRSMNDAGAQGVSLGPTVLRTETAAMALCAAVMANRQA